MERKEKIMRTVNMKPQEFYDKKLSKIRRTEDVLKADTLKDRIRYIFKNEPDVCYEIHYTQTYMYKYLVDDALFWREEIAAQHTAEIGLNVNGTW